MPVSRGTIRHSIAEDLGAIVRTTLQPSSCRKPSLQARRKAEDEVSHYFGVRNTIFFPFARTCFYALLRSFDFPKGSEVLMTPYNISPMVQIVKALGLRPVFIDINLEDLGPDYDQLATALARKPACFLLTYLFGYVPDSQRIAALCQLHGVTLVEDISQSIGARHSGQLVGTFGTAAIYSASITKYVDGYNGAFVLANDDSLADSLHRFTATLARPSRRRLRSIALRTFVWNLALRRLPFNCLTFPLLCGLRMISRSHFDTLLGPSIKENLDAPLPAYYFEDITSLQLQTISAKLGLLNELIERRKACAQRLMLAFRSIEANRRCASMLEAHEPTSAVYWQFLAHVGDTASAQNRLFAHGIETGITNLPNLADLCGIYLANAVRLKSSYIFMPLHDHLRVSDYERFWRVLCSEPCGVEAPQAQTAQATQASDCRHR